MTDWPTILAAAGANLAAARHAEQLDRDYARAVAVGAAAAGVPDARIARLLGVDRMTVRKWVGKG